MLNKPTGGKDFRDRQGASRLQILWRSMYKLRDSTGCWSVSRWVWLSVATWDKCGECKQIHNGPHHNYTSIGHSGHTAAHEPAHMGARRPHNQMLDNQIDVLTRCCIVKVMTHHTTHISTSTILLLLDIYSDAMGIRTEALLLFRMLPDRPVASHCKNRLPMLM